MGNYIGYGIFAFLFTGIASPLVSLLRIDADAARALRRENAPVTISPPAPRTIAADTDKAAATRRRIALRSAAAWAEHRGGSK